MARSSSIRCSCQVVAGIPERTVYVSRRIWDYLFFISENVHSSTSRRKIAVSLGLEASSHTRTSEDYLAWACCPDSTSSIPSGGVFLSRRDWGNGPHVQSNKQFKALVTPVSAIPLSSITLIASDLRSFEIADKNRAGFEQWLCKDERILGVHDVVQGQACEGSVKDGYNSLNDSTFTLSVAHSEPAWQGYVIHGKTRFYVIYATSASLGKVFNQSYKLQEDSTDDDLLLIDENFLGNTMLSGLTSAEADSSRTSISPSDSYDQKEVRKGPFTVKELPIASSPLKHVRPEGEDYTIFVHTNTLGKLGIFDEDWVLLRVPGGSTRLVKISAIQDGHCDTDEIYASSTLIRNCSSGNSSDCLLHIDARHFGSRCPPIPTASSVTLSRIASPLSLDKHLQDAILQSVRIYFEERKRLLKKGDVISVPFNAGHSFLTDEISDTLPGHGDIDARQMEQRASPLRNVHFLVTNLAHEVARNSYTDEIDLDAHVVASVGELGCWVDVPNTRIVQTGIEHLLTPSVTKRASKSQQGHQVAAPSLRRIHEFFNVALKEGSVNFGLEFTLLLTGAVGTGMTTAIRHVTDSLGIHMIELNAYDIIDDSVSKTEAQLRDLVSQAISCSPCVLLMQNMEAFARSAQPDHAEDSTVITTFLDIRRQLANHWQRTGFPVFLVATVDDAERLPLQLTSLFKHTANFEIPTELERFAQLHSSLETVSPATDELVKDIAMQTAGFSHSDILNLTWRSCERAFQRQRSSHNPSDSNIDFLQLAGFVVSEDDLYVAVDGARKAYAQGVGAPSIPNVSWDDVGGLIDVKKDILDTIQLPLEHPELFAEGLKQRSGVLLYGPPGTGKTLLAKAVATSCTLNFLSVKGPEILNMYIGESEANVRRLFQRAREAKPCVIFFDELDSLAPKRGNHGDSGGVMDRIVSQLLAELDGMSSDQDGGGVFVIGATNRPDLLDPALLRPGRFDRLIYLGVSKTHEAQLAIIEALTRKFRLDPKLDLRKIAQQCPVNYTGADFYALCSDAMLKAMSRTAQGIDKAIAHLHQQDGRTITPQYYLSELASPQETEVIVAHEDFMDALHELVASVSQAELEHYNKIQMKFGKTFGNNTQDSK